MALHVTFKIFMFVGWLSWRPNGSLGADGQHSRGLYCREILFVIPWRSVSGVGVCSEACRGGNGRGRAGRGWRGGSEGKGRERPLVFMTTYDKNADTSLY